MTTRLSRFAFAALATAAFGAPARAQFGPPNMGTGPKLPPSGTIARDTAYERKVLEEMKAPDGFTMTLFAGPADRDVPDRRRAVARRVGVRGRRTSTSRRAR